MRTLLQTLLLVLASVFNSFSQSIKVAAAANTQFALKEIVATFEDTESIKIDLIIGSSGKLTAQIINGAPFHIFISANMKYSQHVHDAGFAVAKPIPYAKGTGVLWTTKKIDISSGLDCLLLENIKTIAIASPRNAPYGELAVNALKDAGYYYKIANKLVFGTSVSQVNQYVTLGTVDIGITSKSTVMTPKLKDIGKWIEIENFSIEQGMVMLKYGQNNNQEDAQKFFDFLQSDEACKIFKKYGYIVD